MLTPTVANNFSFFYALGNTPAVNLARGLPHGIDVSLLLLGCGDVRNILLTAYKDIGLPSRKLDVTCNDWDEAILARNILLFSLLIDNKASGTTLWNLYYSLRLEKSDARFLLDHLKKLLTASASFESWKASTYGKILPICDQATFDDVQRVWKQFADALSSDDASAQLAALQANLKHTQKFKDMVSGGGNTQTWTGLRSAAPVAMPNSQSILGASEIFWKSASSASCEADDTPNPLFSAVLSENKVLHYGTDPICGFHLATAYVNLTKASPLKPDWKSHGSKPYAAAKTQFQEWAAACGTLLRKKRLVIRSVASEALALCQTLQNFVVTKEPSAGWYRRQFDTRPLSLDAEAYGGKLSAPATFDAVDTSNLADHVGTMTLLISALPLLSPHPWATLYTETLLKKDDDSKAAFDKLLFGHGPTVSLLLGASPVEYWTNATHVSFVDEVMINLAAGALNEKKDLQQQLHNRMAWKQCKSFSEANAKEPLKIDPEVLADVLFKLYLEIFAHENPMKLLSISQSSMAQMIRNTAYTNFHRGTLVSLWRFLKLRLSVSDFDATVNSLLRQTSSERSLMFTGNLRQELGLQLHTRGLLTESWLRRDIRPNRNLGGFDSWEPIPEVVAVNLVVPKDKITRVYDGSDQAKRASPTIRGALASGSDSNQPWHNFFEDVQLVFGTIVTSGSRDSPEFSVAVEADPAGWSGSSPLIASFYVPAATLQMERKTSYARLEIQASAQNVAVYSKTLGHDLVIFGAKLGDEDSIYISKYLPGQTRYPATCEAAGTLGESRSQANSETEAIFTANASEQRDRIATITGHLDFLSDKGKKLLTDKIPVVVEQASPFTLNVVFGQGNHVYPLTFPVPVDASQAKTRIARKSGYFEVIAPMLSPPTDPEDAGPLTQFIYPTTLARSLSNTPADLNTSHFNLDSLPIIDITDRAANQWMITLLSFQYTVRERRLRQELDRSRHGVTAFTRQNFKESLFSLFTLTTGTQGEAQTGLFSLDIPGGSGTQIHIFVSAVRLDAASGSIVLDAAVLPYTPSIVEKLYDSFLLGLHALEIGAVSVDEDELELWRKTLPAMVERCRTWNHKSACEYSKRGIVPVSLKMGESPLCSCGLGKLPKDFISIPGWEEASKYATRIAISPTYAVPFVDDVVDFDLWKGRLGGGGGAQNMIKQANEAKERCTNCGRAGGTLKKCSQCHIAKYCSLTCQKKDWRKHRSECEESAYLSRGA
ncbi:Deformed epidermal autoregulatory factor 1-like protein [Colletotrichum sidae]|uniref:Deformed epidermal autoregulatory factor 1-like protein n=1 Tax=Colletotrichum sidae TaxID=1347389 RepID=A0A4R8TJI1_9PEZI|nr:Deformed epidermal autoregulatory factor 1-like protein [Colletotrichum sidae]